MNDLQSLTVQDIKDMSYVEFISLLRETNRCPGGKQTIKKILQNSFVSANSNVLEIGSNTGFTSLEIARTVKCKVTGIEIDPTAVEESKRLLSQDTKEIQQNVNFKVGSALKITEEDNAYDLLVAGGATSFMDDKKTALKEYHRVIKPWGFLSITNLCYLTQPPAEVVDNVSEIIGVNINPWSSKQWMDLFKQNTNFEVYHFEENNLQHKTQNEIDEYVSYFIEKEHIKNLPSDVKETIRERWGNTISAFNENHKYLGYILVLFRKRYLEEESEFFTNN
tara:strand:- start:57994 stop:58830 length:837 start_codon:yes stop_codon:yes gene_type:complete